MKPVAVLRAGGSIEDIAAAFDKLSGPEKKEAMYAFKKKDQAKLYELASGRSCDPEYFVPPKTETRKPIVHWGKNSLPTFSKFQKVMCKPAAQASDEVAVGYNAHTMQVFTGPGYFIIDEQQNFDGKKQAVVDYTQLPIDKSDSWPKIISNKARLSRFVYNGLRDWVWKVTDDIIISRASRNGKWMDAWFMLYRA